MKSKFFIGFLLLFLLLFIVSLLAWSASSEKKLPSVSPLSSSKSDASLKPRLPAKKPIKILIPQKGVHKNIIIVKLIEESIVRLRGKYLKSLNPFLKNNLKTSLSNLNNLILRPDVKEIKRLFTRPETELNADKERGEKRSRKQLADLNLYYIFHLISNVNPEPILSMLNAFDIVEIAYLAPIPEPAVLSSNVNQLYSKSKGGNSTPSSITVSSTTNFQSQQGYLNNTGTGVHAYYGWTLTGGTGSSINIIDIEGGWQTTHEDLPTPFTPVDGTNSSDFSWRQHGTAVIGEMVAANNGIGVTGIAYDAQWSAVSIFSYSTANAINQASSKISPGDLILIELHASGPSSGQTCECNCGQFEYLPMEYWQSNFDAISTATANGRIVVEAAGNGSMDLDNSIYNGVFDRNQRDSGAILVGAGYSTSRNPHCWTNYGNRVDAQGWGDSVVTTGYGYLFNGTQDGGVNDPNRYYTSSFSGTSSASPIVTGSAAAIQGRYKYIAESAVLSPFEIRTLISNTGTPQGTGGSWGYKQIGPLPHIEDAMSALSESDDDGYRKCFSWEDPALDNCDCNDSDNTINPGATEICDGKDNDCDTQVDEGIAHFTYYYDNDNDGYGDPNNSIYVCTTRPPDYEANDDDCDDNDPVINPNTLWYQDNDGDGFGNYSLSLQQCTQPAGPPMYVLDNNDYDDNDPGIGAPLKIDSGTIYFHSSLQNAYDAAGDGDTIQCIDVTFIENLTLNIDKTVTLEGGYDGLYSTNIGGTTTLQGDINISSGTLTIENFLLQQ